MPVVPDWGFCGPSYLAVSPVIDAQRSQNLFPEPGYRDSKSGTALIGRPGLSAAPFSTINYPARALWAGDNRLFAVGGTHLYEMNTGGSVKTDYGAMSGSAGSGYCSIIANGTQFLVYDSSAAEIFAASAGGAMVPEFAGTALEYLDGYYLAIATGASLGGANPNQVNCSNYLDGTTWQALNYIIRTGLSDLTTQLATLNGQLWIFGQKGIEVWYNAGNPGFPFARIAGATINLGLMAPGSVVKFSNTIMWLGADDRGYSQVYMAQGTSPVRVSTAAMEALINLDSAGYLPLTQAFGYQEAGHAFYVLNLCGTGNVPVSTYVYDLTCNLWHERVYGGAYPICFASVPGFNSNGPNFVGDGKSGAIYFQGIGYPSDGGATISYTRTSPHVSDHNRWTKYNALEIDADIGTAGITLSYSNDGGRSFKTLLRPDATLYGSNDRGGAFERFKWWQLGRSRDRVFRTQINTSSNLVRIVNAYLWANAGTEP